MSVAAGNPYPSHTQAFVKTHRVGVCRGPYPQVRDIASLQQCSFRNELRLRIVPQMPMSSAATNTFIVSPAALQATPAQVAPHVLYSAPAQTT
jgi:hypothetical protein